MMEQFFQSNASSNGLVITSSAENDFESTPGALDVSASQDKRVPSIMTKRSPSAGETPKEMILRVAQVVDRERNSNVSVEERRMSTSANSNQSSNPSTRSLQTAQPTTTPSLASCSRIEVQKKDGYNNLEILASASVNEISTFVSSSSGSNRTSHEKDWINYKSVNESILNSIDAVAISKKLQEAESLSEMNSSLSSIDNSYMKSFEILESDYAYSKELENYYGSYYDEPTRNRRKTPKRTKKLAAKKKISDLMGFEATTNEEFEQEITNTLGYIVESKSASHPRKTVKASKRSKPVVSNDAREKNNQTVEVHISCSSSSSSKSDSTSSQKRSFSDLTAPSHVLFENVPKQPITPKSSSQTSSIKLRRLKKPKILCKKNNSEQSKDEISTMNIDESISGSVVDLAQPCSQNTEEDLKLALQLSLESYKEDLYQGTSFREISDDFRVTEFYRLWRSCERSLGCTTDQIEHGRLVRHANHSNRQKISSSQSCAQYGRLLFDATKKIFDLVKLKKSEIFIDVGHGIGNAVLQAAFTIGCESRGIEVVPDRCQIADQFRELMFEKFETSSCRLHEDEENPLQVGNVQFREGCLRNPAFHEFITSADVVLVNNSSDIFGTRSLEMTPETKGTSTLDNCVACLFAYMKPGSRLITLHPLFDLGRSLSEENSLRRKLELPESIDASFFTCEKISLGRNSVSWSCNEVFCYVYTRIPQSRNDGVAVFLCGSKECAFGSSCPTAALGDDMKLQDECIYCGTKRAVRTRGKNDF